MVGRDGGRSVPCHTASAIRKQSGKDWLAARSLLLILSGSAHRSVLPKVMDGLPTSMTPPETPSSDMPKY